MTGAVVCGSGMLRAGPVDGRRTAFLAPVWDVGSVSTLCAGPAAVALLREVHCSSVCAVRCF